MWPICIGAGGRSRCFSSRSSRPCNWRISCQRGALAGVDGALGVRAAALLELLVQVVAQLYAALYDSAGGVVGEIRSVELADALWDSRGPFPAPGPARTGVFCRILTWLWDSTPIKIEAREADIGINWKCKMKPTCDFPQETGKYRPLSAAMGWL